MALLTSLPPLGSRVRVTQQLPQRDRGWANTVEGVITRYQQAKTGSWFAHARDDQLWLDRLELRLDDGELVILILDQYTVIEEAPGPDTGGAGGDPVSPGGPTVPQRGRR